VISVEFLPDLPVLLAYTAAAALLTITPGPDMALYLGRTLSEGRAAGFAAFLGTATGLVAHACLAALGVSALLAASAVAFTALKVLGVGYLLFLAVEVVRKGSGFRLEPGPRRSSLSASYGRGLLVNLLNPKIVIFFVTFLPQFVAAGDPHATGKLFFLGLWYIAVTVPITVALILAASRLAGVIRRRPAVLTVLDYAFAGVMAAFAVRLVTDRG
jgi:threonine/homoserine/homoserine lactone efflux protein